MSGLNFSFAPAPDSGALTATPAGYWDVIDRAIGGYLQVQTAKSQARAQERLVDAQLQQALLLGSVPMLQNPDARMTPLTAWSGWNGGGGAPAGGAAGADLGGLLLLGGLVLAAVYLVN